MSTTAIEPWRHTLKTTHAYAQLCFAVDDFSYFEGRVALQEKAPLLYRTQFRNIDKHQHVIGRYGLVPAQKSFAGLNNSEGIEKVKAVAEDAGQEVTRMTKEFATNLETEIHTKPSDTTELPAWREKLKRKNQECKDQLNKMMDDSMNQAIDRIQELPEPMREPATDAYVSASDYMMLAIKKIKEFLDKAWTAIADLVTSIIHGVQVWVEGAVSTIKEWAGDALSYCGVAAGKVASVFASLFG
jgi:phage-related protein